jgi:hypothetical protein
MQTAVVVLALLASYPNYVWRKSVAKPRTIASSLDVAQLRTLFETHIASTGWKVLQSGQTCIAESPAIAGRRQQITLEISTENGKSSAKIYPNSYRTQYGMPSKAMTLDLRIRKFVKGIKDVDTTAIVTRGSAINALSNQATVDDERK